MAINELKNEVLSKMTKEKVKELFGDLRKNATWEKAYQHLMATPCDNTTTDIVVYTGKKTPTETVETSGILRKIEQCTDENTLKKLYRKASLILHPDSPTGNAELFIQLQEVYEKRQSELVDPLGLDDHFGQDDIYSVIDTLLETYEKWCYYTAVGHPYIEDLTSLIENLTNCFHRQEYSNRLWDYEKAKETIEELNVILESYETWLDEYLDPGTLEWLKCTSHYDHYVELVQSYERRWYYEYGPGKGTEPTVVDPIESPIVEEPTVAIATPEVDSIESPTTESPTILCLPPQVSTLPPLTLSHFPKFKEVTPTLTIVAVSTPQLPNVVASTKPTTLLCLPPSTSVSLSHFPRVRHLPIPTYTQAIAYPTVNLPTTLCLPPASSLSFARLLASPPITLLGWEYFLKLTVLQTLQCSSLTVVPKVEVASTKVLKVEEVGIELPTRLVCSTTILHPSSTPSTDPMESSIPVCEELPTILETTSPTRETEVPNDLPEAVRESNGGHQTPMVLILTGLLLIGQGIYEGIKPLLKTNPIKRVVGGVRKLWSVLTK